MNLTNSQLEAIKHLSGPAMIAAGPGSGKTTVIVRHVLYLIRNGIVEPEKILVLTFTRAAANEMSSRFQELSHDPIGIPVFGTFHSIFYRMLKESIREPVKIISERNKNGIIRSLVRTLHIESEEEDGLILAILSAISRWKNTGDPKYKDSTGFLTKEQFQFVLRSYQQELNEMQALDYDDILLRMKDILLEQPEISVTWRDRFSYILVDEFQDINQIQYDILKIMAFPDNNLFVVGDMDQCIYGFRGSQPNLMKQFQIDYLNAKVILLDQNFRCAEVINEAAVKLLQHGIEKTGLQMHAHNNRHDSAYRIRRYRDSREQYTDISEQIREIHSSGVAYEQIAILLRSNRDIPYICNILSEKGIPYTAAGQKDPFLSHFIVRDILAYLKASDGTASRADILRVLNRSAIWIPRYAVPEHPRTDWISEIIYNMERDLKTKSELKRFHGQLLFMKQLSSFASVEYIFHVLGYEKFLKEYKKQSGLDIRIYDPVISMIKDLAKAFPTQKEFQQVLEYEERIKEIKQKSPQRRESVRIQTMHASKGLEYDVVFIPDLNKGIMPTSQAEKENADEERRLLYVAMTRTRIRLQLSYVEYIHGKKAIPSVFIRDLIDC